MFELNKFLFLFLNDLLVFAGAKGLPVRKFKPAEGWADQFL
jgi:hypothetical protein